MEKKPLTKSMLKIGFAMIDTRDTELIYVSAFFGRPRINYKEMAKEQIDKMRSIEAEDYKEYVKYFSPDNGIPETEENIKVYIDVRNKYLQRLKELQAEIRKELLERFMEPAEDVPITEDRFNELVDGMGFDFEIQYD